MKSPLFSCVVPVKGKRPFFNETMESLRNQGMGDDLEIIVQDADVEPDAGQSDALNKGFAKAHGEWLFWLNADDVLLPGVLSKVKKLIHSPPSNSTLSWIVGNTVYFTAEGLFTDVRYDRRWHGFLFRHLPVWSNGPSAFFCRDLWERLGGFDTTLRFGMDIDLWTRWARAGERFVMMKDLVWGFRWHDGSLTSGGHYALEQRKEGQEWLKKMNFRCVPFWRFFLRLTQLLDGSYLLRRRLTALWKGKWLSEVSR